MSKALTLGEVADMQDAGLPIPPEWEELLRELALYLLFGDNPPPLADWTSAIEGEIKEIDAAIREMSHELP